MLDSYFTKTNKKVDNKLYSKLLILIFIVPMINEFLSYLMAFLGINITFLGMNLITVIVFAIAYISSFIVYIKVMKNVKTLCIFLIMLLIYLLEYLIFENNRKYFFTSLFDVINPFYILFGLCIPIFFIIINIKNYDYLLHLMKYISTLTVFFASFVFFFISSNESMPAYMSYAYSLLIPACFSFYYLLKEKKLIYLLSFLTSCITMLVIGSRGALICFVMYVAIKLIYDIINNFNVWKLIGCIVFVLLALFGVLYFNEFIVCLDGVLQSIGIYSRTLSSIIENDFVDSQSRNIIFEILIENLQKNPILGFGIYGDRYLNFRYNFKEPGTYAHNLILEILTHFGMIFGSLILLSLIALLINKTYKLLKQKEPSFDFFLIFVICYLTKSMVTGSYLLDQMFWIFLGLIISKINSLGVKDTIYEKNY